VDLPYTAGGCEGQLCSIDKQCYDPLTTRGSQGFCRGGACSSNSTCASSERANGLKCLGVKCSSDQQCLSGYCNATCGAPPVEPSSNQLWVIVGIILLGVLIAAVAVGAVIYKKRRRRGEPQQSEADELT
jgi:hypothetical protein